MNQRGPGRLSESEQYVAPADRIATFDNDGTLWCEKPIYIHFNAIFARMHEQIADALSRVNELLHLDLVAGRFITAAVGVIDPRDHTTVVLSAGHGPLMFFEAATGRTERWNAHAMPLGISADLDIQAPRVLEFEPGDALVMVTDGFFEWAGPDGREYGVDRLHAFVTSHASLPPHELIRGLHEDVLAFARGTPQADDLTALVVRRSPNG